MRRVCVGVILVLLMVLGPGAGSEPASAADAFPPNVVVYVDNQVADLMWDPIDGAERYVIYTGSTAWDNRKQIWPEEIDGKLFWRVSAELEGSKFADPYRVCAVMEDLTEICSERQNITFSRVKGTLYKSRKWYAPEAWSGPETTTYELDGEVKVLDGVTLEMTDGATVKRQAIPSGPPGIEVDFGGSLRVGGGAPVEIMDITIDFDGEPTASRFSGDQGAPIGLQNVQIDLHRELKVQYCDLGYNCAITVHPGPLGVNDVSNSTFDRSQIRVVDGGEATVSDNTFRDSSVEADFASVKVLDNTFSVSSSSFDRPFVQLRNGADAEIKQNTMTGSYLDIAGSTATIASNQGHVGVHVWPDTGGTVTIEDHASLSFSSYVRHNDPNPPATGGGPVAVTIERNIMDGASFGDGIDVEMWNNSLVGASAGIRCESDGDLGRIRIHNNCLVGQSYGLIGPAGVNASGNWWGSSNGPTHEDNPGGDGTRVIGEADYSAFLRKDNCDPGARDLIACWAEPIQTIQTNGSTVPLVAGKPAVVRAYVASATGELTGVTGELIARRGETLVGTVQAERSVSTQPGVFTCPTALDVTNRDKMRKDVDKALTFKVPGDLLTPGELTLAVEVNPGDTIAENDHSDNTTTITATVVSQNPVSFFLVPLLVPQGDNRVQATSEVGAPANAAELWRKIYPGAQVELNVLPGTTWPYEMDGPTGCTLIGAKHGAMLLNRLGLAHMRLAAEGETGVGPLDQVVGLFPQGTPLYQPRSDPAADGGRGVASFGTAHQEDVANALGPNLGYLSADTYGNPGWQFGYDVAGDRFLPWAGFSDVFDYSRGNPRDPEQLWVFSDDYLELLNYNTGATATGPSALSTGADQTYVLISGVLSQYGEVEFAPAWQVTTEQAPLNPPEGEDYCVELRDGSGAVLESHCFDVAGWSPWRWQSFQAALPLTGSPARVVLRQGTTDLGSVDVSSSPPSVAIQTDRVSVAAGDAVSVSWSGSDGDGDELAYTILYSADDQASWLPAATNITATQYTLNLAEVPGGAKAWVGVEASDGFHTASDLYGPFAVGDHDPMVSIQSPESMEVVSANPSLSGYGYDMEDGELGGGDLVWASDVSGQLGTGQILFATGLTTGTHRLTLTATDSDGQSASDAVTVFVGEAPDVPTIYLPLVMR